MNNREPVFSSIFHNRRWSAAGGPVSGPGSSLEYTKYLIAAFPQFLREFNIKSILDAPCGDMMWMPKILEQMPELKYIGADIVPDLIEQNKKNLPQYDFRTLDICHDTLPHAELLLCRDCLCHLSNQSVKLFLHNFYNSNIPYLMASTYAYNSIGYDGKVWSQNEDIEDGGFRLINLFAEPFNLPNETGCFINDTYKGHPERYLILWSHEQIGQAIHG